MRNTRWVAGLAATILAGTCFTPAAHADPLSELTATLSSPELRSLSSQVAKAVELSVAEAGATRRTIAVPGQGERSYLIDVPAGLDPAAPVDLVFGFGGMDENAAATRSMMRLSSASAGAAIAVYPEPTEHAGHLGWEGPAYGGPRGSDVEFVRAIERQLRSEYAIGATYATGMSNGGGMALSLACQAPEILNAAAVVAAANYAPVFDGCTGQVPTLFIHGTKDGTAPFDKPGWNQHGGAYLSAREAFARVAARNGCTGDALVDASTASAGFTRLRGQGCAADTQLYRVEGGKHSWFKARPDASATVWRFLSSH